MGCQGVTVCDANAPAIAAGIDEEEVGHGLILRLDGWVGRKFLDNGVGRMG